MQAGHEVGSNFTSSSMIIRKLTYRQAPCDTKFMKRVMLVVEEPKESQFLEALLRKMKFDLEIVKVSFTEKYLSFRPEILFVTAKGKKTSGIDIAKKINSKGEGPKIFLIVSPRSELKPKDLQNVNVAGYLMTPINPQKVIELLGLHCNLDVAELRKSLAKAAKSAEQKTEVTESTFVKSKSKIVEETKNLNAKVIPQGDGESKYLNSKFLDFTPPKQTHMNRELIAKKLEDIRKEEVPEDFDEKRREFVEAMFKKP